MKQSFSRRSVLKFASGAAVGALWDGNRVMGSAQTMISRKIPGGTIPCIGLGTYQTFDITGPAERQEAKAVMADFVRLGGQLVDTSPMYGSAESVIGDVTAELNIADRLFLATKVWTTGREAGIQQARESMRRMKTKKLDLIQVHNLIDVETHLRWLAEWKLAKQVRYIGVTHYRESAYADLEKYLQPKAVDFVQFNYSIVERDAEQRLLTAALDSGTAVIVNRPFAKASLFSRVKGRALPDWASDFDAASWAQFFLKYILGHPAVTCVIPATRNAKHLSDNMQAGRGRLPDQKMRQRMVGFMKSL